MLFAGDSPEKSLLEEEINNEANDCTNHPSDTFGTGERDASSGRWRRRTCTAVLPAALRREVKLLAVRGWVKLAPHNIMGALDLTLSLAAGGFAILLATALFRHKLHREFPFFFTYVSFAIMATIARLSVAGDYPMYFKVFWATAALYNILALLALYEVFHEVFLPFYMLWWWFRLLFPGTVGIAALIQIRRAILNPPIQATPLVAAILSFSRVINWVEAMLFGLFFALVLLLGVRWRSYPFGIVEGFGLSALGGLLAYGLRSEFGTKYDMFAKYAPPVAYVVSVLVWLDTFLRQPDPEVAHAWRDRVTPEQLLAEARGYIRILKRFFGTKP